MATTSSSRHTPGVGGKIVNTKSVRFTPYSHPSMTSSSSNPSKNPNWFSGFIFPAKFIASGAAKLFSFFANNDDDVSSTSSSENDDDEIENDVSFQDDDQLDKVMSSSSKSDNKRAIEQLVMEETYSRKEANELINLVRSRIMDTGGNIGETTPNFCTTAIMESKKWLQEKRSGSKIQLENELDVSNMASPSQILRSEKGSPVDIARSYMQGRPVWQSPSSLKKFETGYSSPLGMLHFKDETPKSTLHSSEVKKSSLTSGSWNLLDEIRRVRSKATEELLAATPLTKASQSPFSTEYNQPQHTLMNKRIAEESGLEDSGCDRSDMQNAAVNAPSQVSQDKDVGQSLQPQDSEEAAVLKYDKNDVKPLKSTTAENCFNYSASGMSEEENGNLIDLTQEGDDIDMDDLKPQEEPANDIPIDDAINGSQNSSSMKEDQSQDLSQPVAKDGPPTKTIDTQKERKTRGYTRRGRGRGK